MAWCEENKTDCLLGLARTSRLRKIVGRQMQEAKREHEKAGKALRALTPP